ncbi:hypothetical protein BH23ACT9_BH23ACT9_36290 [soil metagenome]
MRFLIDEMFPSAGARLLRDDLGHDAVHVGEAGLRGAQDSLVAAVARRDERAVVTENVADFAGEVDLVLVCVLKRNLPRGGAQARGLAELLHRWTVSNPRPYIGQHWPDCRVQRRWQSGKCLAPPRVCAT